VGSCLAFHAGSSEGANSVVVWVGVSVAAVVDVGVGRVRVVAVAAVARAGLAGASLLRISRRSIRPLGQAFGSDLYLNPSMFVIYNDDMWCRVERVAVKF
jgi:hypothetical protein